MNEVLELSIAFECRNRTTNHSRGRTQITSTNVAQDENSDMKTLLCCMHADHGDEIDGDSVMPVDPYTEGIAVVRRPFSPALKRD
jgi:hypothetical protein